MGVALIEQALADAEATHFAVDAPRLLERLAAAQFLAGRHALADSKARQALKLAVQSGARGHQAWALRLLGEIDVAKEGGDAETARQNFHQALELASSLGMRPLATLCHEGLSRLHAKSREPLQAEEALSQARALWATLGR